MSKAVLDKPQPVEVNSPIVICREAKPGKTVQETDTSGGADREALKNRFMTYSDQWRLLASRIRGLAEAGRLHAQYLAVRSSDTYGMAKHLREHSERVLSALCDFRDQFTGVLPPLASLALDNFIARAAGLIRDTSGHSQLVQERVSVALILLAAFETEMSFLLSDVQEFIRARSERAFVHLQRSIVVDPDLRKRWQDAFEEGEVACEKLGALHLLLHGIWAFKVDASGARTDLVFQEPANDVDAVQRYADGLVLTEWKKAGEKDNSTSRFENARLQAKRYAPGALSGSELVGYRYAIVVSDHEVDTPNDLLDAGVLYRHVNVAVDPRPPSRARPS